MRRKMDRFLPEETPGGTDASLSVAQHDDRSDPMAVQKHQETLIAIQPKTLPFRHDQRKFCEIEAARFQRNAKPTHMSYCQKILPFY